MTQSFAGEDVTSEKELRASIKEDEVLRPFFFGNTDQPEVPEIPVPAQEKEPAPPPTPEIAPPSQGFGLDF